MKTIGTCAKCKWWNKPSGFTTNGKCDNPLNKMSNHNPNGVSPQTNLRSLDATPYICPGYDFGCIHFDSLKHRKKKDYPSQTPQDLEIADLKRENNAAFDRIQELSQALVRLGYDPTAKIVTEELCKCKNPSGHICGWNSDKCCDCGGRLPL